MKSDLYVIFNLIAKYKLSVYDDISINRLGFKSRIGFLHGPRTV